MNDAPSRDAGDQANEGVRLLKREDLGAIGFSALTSPHSATAGTDEEGPTIAAFALAFGCQFWFAAGWEFQMPAPRAEVGSPAYAAELLKVMSDRLPRRDDVPGVKSVAEILDGLSLLCRDVANGASIDTIGRAALAAGISIGRFGQVGVNNEQYKLALATLEKTRSAKASREETLQEKKLGYERKLLDFALKEVGADPKISNAAIQRRWRKIEKLPETVTSDNEAKTLARFRGDGRLPLKPAGKNT